MHVFIASGRLLATPLYPRLAGAAVLRGPHPGRTAAVCQSLRRRGRRPALAGAAGIRGAGELSSVCGPAARGWPVWLRRSGGGLVPQGPGIINLSLAWPVQQPLGEAAEPIYHSLCAVLQRTLARFGVASHARAVSGSFCDGRYNLACGEGAEARKIVGTAQYWRPLAAGGGHVVLAHAVILIDADLSAAHQAANAFEAQLGSERVYCADKTVTLAQLLPGERHLLPRFSEALAQELDASR